MKKSLLLLVIALFLSVQANSSLEQTPMSYDNLAHILEVQRPTITPENIPSLLAEETEIDNPENLAATLNDLFYLRAITHKLTAQVKQEPTTSLKDEAKTLQHKHADHLYKRLRLLMSSGIVGMVGLTTHMATKTDRGVGKNILLKRIYYGLPTALIGIGSYFLSKKYYQPQVCFPEDNEIETIQQQQRQELRKKITLWGLLGTGIGIAGSYYWWKQTTRDIANSPLLYMGIGAAASTLAAGGLGYWLFGDYMRIIIGFKNKLNNAVAGLETMKDEVEKIKQLNEALQGASQQQIKFSKQALDELDHLDLEGFNADIITLRDASEISIEAIKQLKIAVGYLINQKLEDGPIKEKLKEKIQKAVPEDVAAAQEALHTFSTQATRYPTLPDLPSSLSSSAGFTSSLNLSTPPQEASDSEEGITRRKEREETALKEYNEFRKTHGKNWSLKKRKNKRTFQELIVSTKAQKWLEDNDYQDLLNVYSFENPMHNSDNSFANGEEETTL